MRKNSKKILLKDTRIDTKITVFEFYNFYLHSLSRFSFIITSIYKLVCVESQQKFRLEKRKQY